MKRCMTAFPADHFDVIGGDVRLPSCSGVGEDYLVLPDALTVALIALAPHPFGKLTRPTPHVDCP